MGYETLANIIEYNKEMEELGREDAENPAECPYDAWPLNINSRDEKSCPICGRVWK